MQSYKCTKQNQQMIPIHLIIYLLIGLVGITTSTISFAKNSSITTKQTIVSLVYETKANPPFYFSQDQESPNNLPGASLELFDLVGQNLGIKFTYTRRPWARALEELKDNKFDGIFNASYKDERKQYGVYPMIDGQPDASKITLNQSYVFYKRKQDSIDWNGKELTHFNGLVGTIIGYSINDDMKSMGLKVDQASSQLINLNKLALGRVKLIADIDTMNDGYLKRLEQLQGIEKLSPPIKTKAYYLVFSHHFFNAHPQLANSIWTEISKIRKTNKFNEILSKYY